MMNIHVLQGRKDCYLISSEFNTFSVEVLVLHLVVNAGVDDSGVPVVFVAHTDYTIPFALLFPTQHHLDMWLFAVMLLL